MKSGYKNFAMVLTRFQLSSKKLLSMAFASIFFTFGFLFVVRNRSLRTILFHIASGDIAFLLKLILLALFFFAFQVCFWIWCKTHSNLLKRIFSKTSNKKLIFASIVCATLASFLFLFTTYCMENYPIDEPETVFFVLCSPLEGAEKNFFFNIFLFVIIPVIFIFAICVFISIKHKSLNKNVIYFFFALFPISIFFFWTKFKINEYFPILKEYKEPAEFSQFWQDNFIEPKISEIEFPQKKRNLIFIIMESMESSFADVQNSGLFEENCIPNLTRLANENVNFSQSQKIGGGLDVRNTSWTVAALTAKLGGIPQNLSAASNPTNLPHFLPNAIFLTDILAANGYEMLFLCGSDKGFASRDKLFENHGNVEIHDLNYYRQNGFLKKNYHDGFWGFEDFHLYEFAKMELEKISKNDAPFFLSFLTVDTHTPEGHICEKCASENELEPKIKTVIKCADRQIGDFIEWCKIQTWYENTTIVICGDHFFMVSKATENLFPKQERILVDGIENKKRKILPQTTQRHWLNIFINGAMPQKPYCEKNRTFSSFDVYPTTLAALGAIFPKEGLAFGRNLFSEEQTLLELFGLEKLNCEISKKTIQFEKLVH